MAGLVNLVVLACVLRVTTKKRSSTFSGKKSAPPEKILAMPMLLEDNSKFCQRSLNFQFNIKWLTHECQPTGNFIYLLLRSYIKYTHIEKNEKNE